MKPLCLAAIFFTLSYFSVSQSQSSATGRTRSQHSTPQKIEHAEWRPEAATYFGLTEAVFRDAGLSKLSTNEYGQLLLAMLDVRKKAEEGYKARTFECGPIPFGDDSVKIYVDAREGTPAEIASGVRNKLRNLKGVEIVYTAIESDFGVSLLGITNESESNHVFGYSVSVLTYDQCKQSIADKDYLFRRVDNHYVITAGKTADLVDYVVADIDTHDIETVRQLHAAYKQAPR